MRYTPHIVLFFVLALFALPPSLAARQVINTSVSSQIAEAFGHVILDDFKETTGLGVNLHKFSSHIAINRLKNGFSELAAISTSLSPEDRKLGLVAIPICKDPMVVVAAKAIPVTNLTLDQVRQLFSGFITNWSEVGGPDLPVRVITPIKETGAFDNFERQAMGASLIRFDYEAAKSSAAVEAASYIPGAVTFATRSIVAKYSNIKTFTIDGVDPSSPDYPYAQTFSFVTRGEPSGVIREVINYAMSKEAREYMRIRGITPSIQ